MVEIKGSHHQFRHPSKKGRVKVPHPKIDLPKGTVHSILKQAGVNPARGGPNLGVRGDNQ
nr:MULTISPECIES: type II toxin-antitoxin system HicA family toxin [unclassified Pseudomonas]